MWLFGREGFFSAVKHRNRDGYVLVRARCRADIERLCDAVGLPRDDAQHTPEADYLWRVEMSKKRWASYVENAAQEIDYDNFKNAVHGERARDRAYLEVWQAMFRFQEGAG